MQEFQLEIEINLKIGAMTFSKMALAVLQKIINDTVL
jgi:hypothetical protein